MENGIYQIRLSSGEHCVEGIVVVHDNAINGGGGGYYCRGMVSQEDQVLSGRMVIRKWDDEAYHELGVFKEVSVAVTGRYDPEKRSFDFQGQANGHHVIQVQATGYWIASPAKAGQRFYSK
jgi:hypothetical protein